MIKYIYKTYIALRNKITNKIFYFVKIDAVGKRKGFILISYITSPFIDFPWEYKTDPHSNYWECAEIAKLFSSRGYEVHCINANVHKFIPKKNYSVCIDVQIDLERLSRYLNKDCIKVIHIDNPNYSEYNKRELNRIEELFKRKGVRLLPRRQVKYSRSLEMADYLEGFGNNSVLDTYKDLNKVITKIPVSVTRTFDFPFNKDFNKCRKNFLYFGGGGAILKGLDLVIEAFAELPNLNLHILGPLNAEKDLTELYKKELCLPNITYHGRPKIDKMGNIKANGKDINEIFDSCIAIIYPSSADGTSTAVVQSIHAGLIPIVSSETGLDEKLKAIILPNKEVTTIKQVVTDISNVENSELRKMAYVVWQFVNNNYTRESFSKNYDDFINKILKI